MGKDMAFERSAEEGRNGKCRGRSGRLRCRKGRRETCDDAPCVLSPPLSPEMYSPLSPEDPDYGSVDNSERVCHCSPAYTNDEALDKPTDDGSYERGRGRFGRPRRRTSKQDLSENVTPPRSPTRTPKLYGPDSAYDVHFSGGQEEPHDAHFPHFREEPDDSMLEILNAIKMAAFFVMGISAFALSALLLVIWSTAAYCFVMDKDFTESAVGAYTFRNSPYWEHAVRKVWGGLMYATVDVYTAILAVFQGIIGRLGALISGAYFGIVESVFGFTLNNADFEKQQTESLMRMHQLHQQQYMVVLLLVGAAAICLIEAALISLYRRQLVNSEGPRISGIFVCMHQRLFHILGLETATALAEATGAEPAPHSDSLETGDPVVQCSVVQAASDDAVSVTEDIKPGKDGGNVVVGGSLEVGSSSAKEVQPVSFAGLILEWGWELAMSAKRLRLGARLSPDYQPKEAVGTDEKTVDPKEPTKATTAAALTPVDGDDKLREGRDLHPETANQLSVHPGDLPASVACSLPSSDHKAAHDDDEESVSESEWCIVTSTETCAPSQ